MAKDIVVPVWEKYSLSIEEAAVYFRIGENTIREIIKENPDADFWFLERKSKADKKKTVWAVHGFAEGCLKKYRRLEHGMVW